MKAKLPKIFYAAALVCIIFGIIATAGADYLVSYALTPAGISRNDDEAWNEACKNTPGLQEWRDSLVKADALRDTTINTFGYDMHAWIVRAPHPTAATALLLHGYTDCGISMMPVGRMYNRDLGMNILVPDLTNAGQTDFDHFEMGFAESAQAAAWADATKEIFGDSVRIVVHGISMGAATTMMVAGRYPEKDAIKAYVEDCGYTSVDEQYTKELRERFGLPRWPLIPLASLLCHERYGWHFSEVSPLEVLKKVKKPMLFIHGTADTYVPTAMVHRLYEAKRLGKKKLWLAPNAKHARSYQSHPKEYTQQVRNFLKDF